MSDVQMKHGYVYLVNRKNSKAPFILGATFSDSKTRAKNQLFHINEAMALSHKECFEKVSVVRATIVLGEVVSDDED